MMNPGGYVLLIEFMDKIIIATIDNTSNNRTLYSLNEAVKFNIITLRLIMIKLMRLTKGMPLMIITNMATDNYNSIIKTLENDYNNVSIVRVEHFKSIPKQVDMKNFFMFDDIIKESKQMIDFAMNS